MGEPGATFFSLDDEVIEIERIPEHIIEHADPVVIHDVHDNVYTMMNDQTLYAGTVHCDRILQKGGSVQPDYTEILNFGDFVITTGNPDEMVISNTLKPNHIRTGTSWASQYLGNVTPQPGEAYLSLGGFEIVQGQNQNVAVSSQWPINAPNIHPAAGTHEQLDNTVVVRSYADGTHMKNLVVENHTPVDDDFGENGWRPGLNFVDSTHRGNADALQNGRFRFFPYEETQQAGVFQPVPGAFMRFGRAEDATDPTGAGNGLYLQRDTQQGDLAGTHQRVLVQVHKNLPSLRIEANKETNVPFIECVDSRTGTVVCAIGMDGTLQNAWHHTDQLSSLVDVVAHSAILGGASLYIGNMRFSWDQDQGRERIEKIAGIPSALLAAPYSVTTADLGGTPADQFTVQQYIKLARNKSGVATLKASDIFTSQHEGDWVSTGLDHCATLTSDAQSQVNALDSRLSTSESDIASHRCRLH